MNNFQSIIDQFDSKNILVIGDLILDKYLFGSVSRISPEAPVPIVVEKKRKITAGGAANVANNLKTLGANVTLIGRVGQDEDAQTLIKIIQEQGIDVTQIVKDKNLPTISKTRVLAQNHQMMRIDKEDIRDWSSDTESFQGFKKFYEQSIDQYDAVIISDYGKGLVTPELIDVVCSTAVEKQKIVTVDPKVGHFSYYKNVTSITPNLKETENAIRNIKISSNETSISLTSDLLSSDEDVNRAGQELLTYLGLESLLVTLSERGMRLFEKGQEPVSIPTQAREVFDVTGAGDAVISVFTLAMTTGVSKADAAKLSNYAAGIVVGHMGAVAVSKQELLEAI